MVARFIRAALDGKSPVIFGDGQQTRDLVYIDNVVAAILAALEVDDPPAEPLNIASGEAVAINFLWNLVLEPAARSGWPSTPPTCRRRRGSPSTRAPQIARACKVLGWAPAVRLREGLAAHRRALPAPAQRRSQRLVRAQEEPAPKKKPALPTRPCRRAASASVVTPAFGACRIDGAARSASSRRCRAAAPRVVDAAADSARSVARRVRARRDPRGRATRPRRGARDDQSRSTSARPRVGAGCRRRAGYGPPMHRPVDRRRPATWRDRSPPPPLASPSRSCAIAAPLPLARAWERARRRARRRLDARPFLAPEWFAIYAARWPARDEPRARRLRLLVAHRGGRAGGRAAARRRAAPIGRRAGARAALALRRSLAALRLLARADETPRALWSRTSRATATGTCSSCATSLAERRRRAARSGRAARARRLSHGATGRRSARPIWRCRDAPRRSTPQLGASSAPTCAAAPSKLDERPRPARARARHGATPRARRRARRRPGARGRRAGRARRHRHRLRSPAARALPRARARLRRRAASWRSTSCAPAGAASPSTSRRRATASTTSSSPATTRRSRATGSATC